MLVEGLVIPCVFQGMNATNNHTLHLNLVDLFSICDALRHLVPFVQFKNMKSTHGGVLLLVKLHCLSLKLC